MDGPTLTIAIVSHKQSHLVRNLLASLEAYKPEIRTRLVIIENVEGQPEIHPSGYDLPLTYKQNDRILSLSANLNQAFRLAGEASDYFCVLNPDIVFEGEVFSALISALDQHKADIVAPLIVDSQGVIQDSFRSVPTPIEIVLRRFKLKKTVYTLDSLSQISYPDWIGAMFMLMPSDVYEKVGGFDPKFDLYMEDVDFCLRAWQKGLRVGVVKNVRVIHEAQRKSQRSRKYMWTHISSAVKFFASDVYRNTRKRRRKG